MNPMAVNKGLTLGQTLTLSNRLNGDNYLVLISQRMCRHIGVCLISSCGIAPGCVHVCLHFAVDVGLSGECMFHVLIVIFILVLNCEVLVQLD